MARNTQFPNSLMISQADTEAVLESALANLGVVVERGLAALKVSQDSDGVTALLKTEDGEGEEREEEVRCKYVVGCDGAHSVVRKSCGMKFEGGVYPQDFILADVRLKWEHKTCLSFFLGSGFLGVFPLADGISRLIISRAKDRGRKDEPTLKDFQEFVDEVVPGTTEVYDPVWITRFRLHHRIVDNYRKGRAFVAGDAAHIHSPAGGQGMNTGMQDAVNLAWKLATALSLKVGEGEEKEREDLLDSYDGERRNVGLKLLNGTDRLFEMMATSNWVWIWVRNTLVQWVAPWVMSNKKTVENRFRFVSQLGIRYRGSPIVGRGRSWKGILKGGDRAPDGELSKNKWALDLCKGVGWHLLLFSGVGLAAVSSERLEEVGVEISRNGKGDVKVHKILSTRDAVEGNASFDEEGKVHELYDFKEPGYVLVRPDGYISFIGGLDTVDELKIWVKK